MGSVQRPPRDGRHSRCGSRSCASSQPPSGRFSPDPYRGHRYQRTRRPLSRPCHAWNAALMTWISRDAYLAAVGRTSSTRRAIASAPPRGAGGGGRRRSRRLLGRRAAAVAHDANGLISARPERCKIVGVYRALGKKKIGELRSAWAGDLVPRGTGRRRSHSHAKCVWSRVV